MKKTLIFGCLLILLAGPVCAKGDVCSAVIRERLGHKFQIVLVANPTTGYQWQLADKLNGGKVKLISSKYSGPDSKLVGAGGREIWMFQAIGRGHAVISFKYVRPWEKEAKPAERRTYEIVIK